MTERGLRMTERGLRMTERGLRMTKGLSHEGVEGADGEEGLAASEAEAFGCGNAYAKAGV
jgi:hypothetical protein